MDKKILLICLIAIVAFSISCVSAADSNEIVMNSSDAIGISEDISVDDVVFANQISSEDSQVVGDSPSGEVWVATTGSDDNDGSQASPVASVSKAVDLAQSGSTIHIKEGTYNQGKISLTKSLSFVGEGKVILNSNGANVFACENDGYNLEFTNLVFTGVSSTAGTSCGLKVGGNGNLKVINCTFTDISAKYGAMQLYTTGVADIINSTIKDVTCGVTRGSIVYISGTGEYNFDNLSIINPKLSDSVTGAAVHLRNVFYVFGVATVTLTNSRITGASGPMMSLIENKGTLTISNTVISNNVIGKTESGINGQYLLYLGNSNFVTALNMTNCIIENNTFGNADTSALAYIFKNSIVNLTYSSIMNNGFSKNLNIASGITPTVNLDYNWWGTNTYTGDNVNKWAVMSTPETTINAESGKAIDVSVNFNHYTDASGSIQDLAQSISGINVDFSAVSGTLSKNNVASVDGIATVTYTTTTNDKITAKSGSQSLTIDVVAKQAAADIWVATTGSDDNDGSQANPVATIAKAIELAGDGYTIHIADGNYVNDKTLSISKSLTLEGSANTVIDGNASKIMNINENTIVNFTNVAFTNALNNYGGVMQSKGTVNLNNVSIYKNTQKSGSTPTVSSIYNTGVMTIVNSNIYENDGYGLIFNSGNLDIINTSISSNNVAKGTTYAFLYIDSGAVNVINSTLSDNTARLGGIWLNKGTLNVNNATFENNVVTVGNGGAIHIESDSSTATIKDSKFIGNKANKDGGAIYNKGTLNIETSIFDANAASNGNTGYHGDDIYNSGILTLHYSALLGKGTNKLIYNEGREPSANAQYNWWGTNSNPSTLVGAGLDYDDEPCDDVDVSNWVVMSVDPTSIEKVIVGNEKTLTVNFNHYNANGVIKELAKSIPSINVNFEAVNGTLSSDVAATDNGVASVTYTVKGNDQITVKSGSQTLTVPVTTKELTNIVTNETFFDYFGDDGMLLGDITFDTLIFKGEFSNLGVNVVYVPRAIVINGDNAVLRNIAIMCEQGTTLNNLTLNATNYVADTDGALIYAIGSDVTVNNITIDYNATDGSNNAIAVYASGADNFKLVNSTITFTGNNVDGKVFAQGIKIAKSNNAVVDSNIITTSCPLVDVDYSQWGSIDTDLVFAIGVEKSENVKIINNIMDNSAWTKGNNANFPTFDAFIAHTANNLLIKNNTISHTDLITPKGTSSYIYALDFYESNSVIVEDNRVLLNTTGGKEGAGAAYAVQVTGPYNNFVVKGNNLTTVSNGPNLGVYSQNYYGATEITAENNWINVTGFAGPAEFALVSGMEFQDTVAKAYNNIIYVQNVNEYNDDNNIAGITYVQSTSGSHQFDIQNNTIYSEGKYAVLIKSAKDSQIIGNTLYAHELNGDDAAIFKSGTNNVVKNNYPMSTDIIIDVNNAWIGKEAVIGITLNSAATGTANIMVGGKTYTVNLTDGKATLKVSDLPAGENTVKVDYDGDGKFKSSTNSTTFKVFDGIVTNETFFDYFINGTLADYVPEGATLDFRGKFYSHDDVKFDLVINKPINMISTTGDAFIDLNTTAGSLLGENPGSRFTINNGGSGSNVSGIIFHNTQVWIYDAHNVVLNNISVIVENKRVGSGVGTTAIRHGSTNVTLKNSYIYTSNNGGSSSIVLTHVQNCTVENNTIVGEGNVGNLLYLNTFNDAGCDLSNDYNKIINNKITGPSPAAGICYGIGINGNNNLIAGNVINYAGNGIVPAWGATPNNNTYCDNVLIGGASMSVAASSIAYNNTVSGTLTIGSDSVAYNNTAKAISVSSNSVVSNSSATATLTVQAGAKVANVTAASLSVNGKNAVIENVSISGVGTIKSSATNTTLINSTFGGMLTVQSAKNTIKYNNIVLATGDAAILATGGDNVITNNYLIAGDKLGDNAVNSTVETNIVKDNLPGGIVNVTITAKDVFEGSDVIIDVTVDSLSNLTEKFMLKINNKEYVLSFTDSKANVTISDLTAGKYDIAVTYGDETYTLINATSDVSVYGNVVTNETFFIYFDEDGLLREEVPFDELIFKGEFSDIVNLISITTPLKITSDNAVLRNIAFAVLSDNVVLNGLTLISNVSCADNGGALMLVAGNNVNVSNMNISYIIKESVDAVAINANGVSNLNVVNSNIFFESCPKDDTLTACVINIDGVSNSFINGNNITAVLPYLFASNYDMKYFMMGVNTVNPIRMRECNNVTFSKNNVNTTANDGSASFPTLQCMFIVGSNDCVIDGNNFSMIDTLIPAGTSNYLYGINIGYNKNLMISNNDFKMSTAGGKDAAGTAYAIQGVECEVSMIGNNITSISNGPNLGIYFASMTGGTSELYIANNLINVTGLASASGSWALVSGIEVQNGNAKIYNNTVYTYNVGDYSPENYMYGISYAQFMYGDRSFDIRDNRIYVDGHYAVSFINVDGSNVTGNLLITRDLGGDAAVEIKAGKNNVVENNYPRSSDLIFNITSEEPGKILIDVTIDKKATGNIAVIVDGDKYDVAIVNGSAKLTLSDLPAGVYYIEAKYNGNSIVTESYNSTKFTIDLIDSSIAVEAKNIKCGEEAVITATVTNGATGTVTFFVNGKTYVVDITGSVATLKIADLTTGDYPVFAYYNGDKYYKTSYNSTTFNVAKLASTTTVNVSDIKVGEDAVISIAVPEITSGVVSVTVGDAIYNVAVVDGKGSLTLSGLASGSYDVVAKFNGDDKYLASEDSAKFNVTKLASTIDIAVDNIKVGEDAVIGVALPEDATGEVIISVNGKNYTVMTKYGMASVTISDLANGTYSVDAFYNGDDIYAPIKNSTAFTVSKVSDYNMTVDIADIVKGENATITVSVPEDGTGNVIVTINGTDYKGTVVNGTAKVIIPGLDEGTYKVVTFYTGDNKYDSMIVNGTITVNKNTKTTLTMDNLVKYFNGPQKLMAKLVDGFGNPIANATVYFTINGKVYARITDENGTASIAIRLLPGEYKASALFNGTDDYDMAAVNASVLVKNTILGNDTTLYFRNGTQYVAKFLDGNGKALANTDVKFNINGVFYTRVTDENGIARLNIRLDPASYIITAYNPVTGEQKANNITVLPRIIAKDLSMKYLDGSTFNAALVDGQGKAISGVNITFNINGVFYHRTTNADGVTKLNIRLMPGEYIITSMYDECWASNKIIISA